MWREYARDLLAGSLSIRLEPADRTTYIVRVYFRDDEDESYTRICARDQTADANKLECSWSRARADFRRHSRDHQSSISVYQASGRRIYCDARVDRTYQTEIDAVPGRCITDTLRGPSSIQTFPTRGDQSSHKWRNKNKWYIMIQMVPFKVS